MMIDQLLTGRNLSLAGGIFVLMSVLKNFVAPTFWAGRVGQRALPVLPLLFGIGLSFAGLSDASAWQDKLLIGLIAGWASSHTFKLGSTSLLGNGLPDKADSVPSPGGITGQPPTNSASPTSGVTVTPADKKE